MEKDIKKMEELYDLVQKYNYSYHTLDKSLVSDYEYDKLIQELINLEKKYPKYKKESSITEQVGNVIIDKFKKAEHNTPMLSLNNAFSLDDLREFDMKVRKEIGENYTYVCELKIDGVAISLTFSGGKLSSAITRGNGQVGEDVTHNVKTIKDLPSEVKGNLEVRGEIYINKSNFLDIQKKEKVVYANPRNLAAGTIRQLDNKVAKNRNLSIFIYGLTNYEELNHKTYYESMMYLKDKGFITNEKLRKVNNIEEVCKYVEEITKLREKLDYEIDGLVIKVNEYVNQEELGYTAKFPKWAIAYKFKSDAATTKLLDIIYTVGRTGKITPNAVLEPVFLMGSQISKATLHNEDYILEKDVKIGDVVRIIKAGDIIPRVEEVLVEKRDKNQIREFKYAQECPECNHSLVKRDKDYFCDNKDCPGKNIEKILYFISENGFDMKGLGNKIVEKLYDTGIVNDYIDIFDLNFEKLYSLEGFKDKSVNNVLQSIEGSKDIELFNFITAFGISGVGQETAKTIVKQYKDINDIKKATIEELEQIDGIGQKIAQSIYDFFGSHNNLEKMEYLISKGVMIKNTLYIKGEDKLKLKLLGKTFVITGTFENYKRSDLKKELERNGAKVSSSVSKKTDYILCGEDAGSKLTKAQDLEIKIIKEEDLQTLEIF